jgi:hypothetical protein
MNWFGWYALIVYAGVILTLPRWLGAMSRAPLTTLVMMVAAPILLPLIWIGGITTMIRGAMRR